MPMFGKSYQFVQSPKSFAQIWLNLTKVCYIFKFFKNSTRMSFLPFSIFRTFFHNLFQMSLFLHTFCHILFMQMSWFCLKTDKIFSIICRYPVFRLTPIMIKPQHLNLKFLFHTQLSTALHISHLNLVDLIRKSRKPFNVASGEEENKNI